MVCSGKLSNVIIKRLKESLSCTEKYFLKWKIKINQEKTQAIIFPFNKFPKRIPSLPLKVCDTTIEIRDSIKYLGAHLNKKLTLKNHVDHVVEKAIKCGRALFPLLNRKSILKRQNKLLLYRMCLRPIMTYGCLWFGSLRQPRRILENYRLYRIKTLLDYT